MTIKESIFNLFAELVGASTSIFLSKQTKLKPILYHLNETV